MVLIKLPGTLLRQKKIGEHDVSKDCSKTQNVLKESTNDSISNLVHKRNNKNMEAIINESFLLLRPPSVPPAHTGLSICWIHRHSLVSQPTAWNTPGTCLHLDHPLGLWAPCGILTHLYHPAHPATRPAHGGWQVWTDSAGEQLVKDRKGGLEIICGFELERSFTINFIIC